MAALISRLLQQTLEVVYNLQVLHKHGSITTARCQFRNATRGKNNEKQNIFNNSTQRSATLTREVNLFVTCKLRF